MLQQWKRDMEMINSRNAAVTNDEISVLLSDIDLVTEKISAYIAERKELEPRFLVYKADEVTREERFKKYSGALVEHSLFNQLGYEMIISPLVISLLTRISAVLGEANSYYMEAFRTESYAKTNYFTMQKMVRELDVLKEKLIFR